jgi:UDP-N-acetyl-D-glucosamine dehydrogenase
MHTDVKTSLIAKLNDRTAKVVVLGMGYVGLPLATVFGEAGFSVTGIDPVAEKVELLNKGESYVGDISSAQVARLVSQGRLTATTDYSAIQSADAVSICVPTPLRKSGDPDMSYIISAMEGLAPYLHSGMVIVLESTTYPGTTRELMLPALQKHSGWRSG